MNISPVLVQWTYHGDDQTGFLLERSVNSGSDGWPLRWGFDKGTLQYIDSAVGLYGSYWYRVAAANPKGTGSFSNLATVFIGPPAFDIAQLTASQVDKELENLLSWHYTGSSEGGTDYYLIEKSLDNGATWPVSWSVDGSGSNWTDNLPMTYSLYYDYRITPHSDFGLYGPTSNITASFMQAPGPTLYVWQSGSSAIAFWNYLGSFTMSLSRSVDGGATWPMTALVTPTSGSTYYYFDRTTSIGNTYTYRIQEIAKPNQPTATGTKTVLDYSPTTSLAFGADSGYDPGSSISYEIHTASLLEANNAARGQFSVSRWILGGDNGYAGQNWYNGYQGQCFSLLGPSESIWAIMGNHDQSDMGGVASYLHYFGYKTAQFTWKEGCVQGFNITTTQESDTTYASGSANWLFLSNSLSRSLNDSHVAWRIVVVHCPVISSDFAVHSAGGNPTLRAIPWQQWGVNGVFSGHQHSFERLESGSVFFVTDGAMCNLRSPYFLVGSPHTCSKWILADRNDGSGPYCGGYVWTHIQATPYYFSMSFYSGSTKVHDTGSTSIPGAHMDGYSFIWEHLPPAGTPSLSSSTLSV
jgi:hypothetical protein